MYKKISAVFQNFGKYKLTLRENAMLSEIDKPYDELYFYATLKRSEFDSNKAKLSKGIDTMMCRRLEELIYLGESGND